MALVRATHLEHWSNTIEARNKLGDLLRKLIHAGVPLSDIRAIHFLADEANQISGWDGILDCNSGVPWIPNGTSVWELGAGSNHRAKIKADFEKRTKQPLPEGWNSAETSYIAVTLRKVDDLTNFENELKENSPWADVKIIDSTILEEWIAEYIAIETWLQEQGVGLASGIQSLTHVWKEWAEVTNPIMNPDLVLVDREQDATAFRTMLSEEGAIIKVKADSPKEAIGFMYASVATAEPSECADILNKSIVINDPSDCLRLTGISPHIVILRPPATSKVTAVNREGHKVVCAFGNSTLSRNIDISLKRPLRSSFSSALTEIGVPKEKAEIEARACGSSPSVWRVWNQLDTGDPTGELPEWAKAEHADITVPAILLGGWSDRYRGDKEALQAVSGLNFEDYCDKLQRFLSQDEPFITKIDDAWIVTAPATAFALVINHITQGALNKFQNVLATVFSEIDPTIDLAPEERPYASMHGHVIHHSTWLRDGLAETLLRIAVIGDRLEENGSMPGNLDCQSFVDQQLKALLGLREDWRLIMSLRDQLPVLAEAAPIPFMEALARLLQGHHDDLNLMFAEGDSIFGHAFHPHLLWALETLAWEPNYLTRVSSILAKLDEADPGGRLSNRPMESLRAIFLPWYPGTSANLQQRVESVEYLLKSHSDKGWELLTKLLPSMHAIAHDTNEPKWRDFGRAEKRHLTRKDVWEAYTVYVDLAIRNAGSSPQRWIDLFDVYPNILKHDQERICAGLERLREKPIDKSDQYAVWKKLRETISHHRSFPDAAWVMPTNDIEKLEALTEKFTPNDLTERYSWLFDQHMPDIGFPRTDHDKHDQEVHRLRVEAIREILQTGGADELLRLISASSFPGFVAKIVVTLLPSIDDVVDYFKLTMAGSQAEQIFARVLSIEAFNRYGDDWVTVITTFIESENWDENAITNFLLYFPDNTHTYTLVESFGNDVAYLYWAKKDIWLNIEDDNALLYAINKFLEVDRAIEVLNLTDEKLDRIGQDVVYQILEQVINEVNKGKSLQLIPSADYWIERIFDWLRELPDLDIQRLARLEYSYLPLLTRYSDRKHLLLHKLMSQDPVFFVDVITDLYKAEHREEDSAELPDEERKMKAQLAWDLLHVWTNPPGVEEGHVDVEKMRNWITTARKIANERDRTAITDQHIGNVLYYVPSDPKDAIWPHSAVRQLLEELQNENIERGIAIEQFNARGVTSKAVFEGGSQERDLAKMWRTRADNLASSWPRASTLAESIAQDWEREAEREDQRAEKDRVRFR